VSNSQSPLRLNVGFIIHQTIGYSHNFDFDIPQIHLQPDLILSNLVGTVTVTRTPQGLLVRVKMKAKITTDCVRCLSEFDQPLDVDFSELFAFNRKSVTESGLILPEDGRIDLAPLLREFMFLEVPIKPLCRPDCKGLCPECGENLNLNNCNHPSTAGDSRFDVLKDLRP
jgi:uncharacterized protein